MPHKVRQTQRLHGNIDCILAELATIVQTEEKINIIDIT
jgi:hypothetical protein